MLRDHWGTRLRLLFGGSNRGGGPSGSVVFLACNWETTVPVASGLASHMAGRTVACMSNGLRRNGTAFGISRCQVPSQPMSSWLYLAAG